MRVVPAGPALADLLGEVVGGRVPGVTRVDQLFNDNVHLTNLGNYYVALLHYAVVFRRSPVGLTADGLRPIADAAPRMSAETARHLQTHAARWAQKTFDDEARARRSEAECVREIESLCRSTLGNDNWGCTQVAASYGNDTAEVPEIREPWCRR